MYLVLELWEGGSPVVYNRETKMYTNPTTNRPLPLSTASKYLADVACGLKYLKSQGVIHRDIKPENLLTNATYDRCCICDFGCARKLSGMSRRTGMVSDTSGTLAYFPPEACLGEQYDGFQADVWALGVTMYVFLYGQLPFSCDEGDPTKLFERITKDVVILSPKHCDGVTDIPAELLDLVNKMLDKDFMDRICIEDVLKHPAVEPFVDEDKK